MNDRERRELVDALRESDPIEIWHEVGSEVQGRFREATRVHEDADFIVVGVSASYDRYEYRREMGLGRPLRGVFSTGPTWGGDDLDEACAVCEDADHGLVFPTDAPPTVHSIKRKMVEAFE